jgi:hypothetical protein
VAEYLLAIGIQPRPALFVFSHCIRYYAKY